MDLLAEVEKLPRTEEEWFASWKETNCEVFCNKIGSAAQKMGEDDVLG